MNKLIHIVVGSTLGIGILVAPRPALAGPEGQCPDVIGSTISCSSGDPTWLPSANRCHLSTAYYVYGFSYDLFPTRDGPYYHCCTYATQQQFCGGNATGNYKEYFRTISSDNAVCLSNSGCVSNG